MRLQTISARIIKEEVKKEWVVRRVQQKLT